MTAYCVKQPGLCDRTNCCMDGKRPGYDPRCCHKTVLTHCTDCPYVAPAEPVMVKLDDVINTIITSRHTIPVHSGYGVMADIVKRDLVRHLCERFGK